MSKQLKFTKKEQNVITKALMDINVILLKKMDNRVSSPCLEGSMTMDDDDREVTWVFNAKHQGYEIETNE